MKIVLWIPIDVIVGRDWCCFFGVQRVRLFLLVNVDIRQESTANAHTLHRQDAIAEQRGDCSIENV